MCLAIPGKIKDIKENIAIIDYGGLETKARIIKPEYSVGDYVLVQNKIVVEKIPSEQAEEFLRRLND